MRYIQFKKKKKAKKLKKREGKKKTKEKREKVLVRSFLEVLRMHHEGKAVVEMTLKVTEVRFEEESF